MSPVRPTGIEEGVYSVSPCPELEDIMATVVGHTSHFIVSRRYVGGTSIVQWVVSEMFLDRGDDGSILPCDFTDISTHAEEFFEAAVIVAVTAAGQQVKAAS